MSGPHETLQHLTPAPRKPASIVLSTYLQQYIVDFGDNPPSSVLCHAPNVPNALTPNVPDGDVREVQPATAQFLKEDGWPGSNWLKGRITGSNFLSRALCRGAVARRLLAKSAA